MIAQLPRKAISTSSLATMPSLASLPRSRISTYHGAAIHLESLTGIASAKVGIEDNLLRRKVRVKATRALEVGRRHSKLGQVGLNAGGLPSKGGWHDITSEAPHLNALGCPEHGVDASTSGIESRARRWSGYSAASIRVGVLFNCQFCRRAVVH